MPDHIFGGDWTERKLEAVKKYLAAYTKIFTENEKASYFQTIYLDAFAGTGHRKNPLENESTQESLFEPESEDEDQSQLLKGSARIALEVEPPFDEYVFLETETIRVTELQSLTTLFPLRRVVIEQAEANKYLQAWCKTTDWKKHRAVVFLDPYGMQVDWVTVERIAATKAIDLWLLYPIGVAVNRMLPNEARPPKSWSDTLTRFFGTNVWEDQFYKTEYQPTLFGDEVVERRDASFAELGKFFLERLQSVFHGVAPDPLLLKNSRDMPMYLLCFAAGNAIGSPTAVKIANDIIRNLK